MTRDDYLKQLPDEDNNSVYSKLKRAQRQIMTLKKENEWLKAENESLDRKYVSALKKAGVYRTWLVEAGVIEGESCMNCSKGDCNGCEHLYCGPDGWSGKIKCVCLKHHRSLYISHTVKKEDDATITPEKFFKEGVLTKCQ